MASKYTLKEDFYIQSNYLEMNDNLIGRKLKRAERGVKMRRLKLGLHRPEDFSGARKHRNLLMKNAELSALRSFLNTGIMRNIAIDRIKMLQNQIPEDFKPRKKHIENSLKKKAEAFEMLKSGVMIKDTAERFNVSRQTVASWKSQFSNYNGEYPAVITLKSKV